MDHLAEVRANSRPQRKTMMIQAPPFPKALTAAPHQPSTIFTLPCLFPRLSDTGCSEFLSMSFTCFSQPRLLSPEPIYGVFSIFMLQSGLGVPGWRSLLTDRCIFQSGHHPHPSLWGTHIDQHHQSHILLEQASPLPLPFPCLHLPPMPTSPPPNTRVLSQVFCPHLLLHPNHYT
jgi:hypothetical protein